MSRLKYLFPINFLHRWKVFSETERCNIGYSDTTVRFQKVLDTEHKRSDQELRRPWLREKPNSRKIRQRYFCLLLSQNSLCFLQTGCGLRREREEGRDTERLSTQERAKHHCGPPHITLTHVLWQSTFPCCWINTLTFNSPYLGVMSA